MNAVTTTSVTTRGGYSSVKSRQPQMQPQPQQMTDHHHTQRQMLPDQQHIQGYSSQQQQHLSNNTGELKFIYSEKATRFCKIFTIDLSYVKVS